MLLFFLWGILPAPRASGWMYFFKLECPKHFPSPSGSRASLMQPAAKRLVSKFIGKHLSPLILKSPKIRGGVYQAKRIKKSKHCKQKKASKQASERASEQVSKQITNQASKTNKVKDRISLQSKANQARKAKQNRQSKVKQASKAKQKKQPKQANKANQASKQSKPSKQTKATQTKQASKQARCLTTPSS